MNKVPQLLIIYLMLMGFRVHASEAEPTTAGRVHLEHGSKQISYETIYQWIYRDEKQGGSITNQ
jgi:IS30 family transposase